MAQTLRPKARIIPPGTPLELCFQVHEDNIVLLRGLLDKDLKECGDIGTQTDDLFLLRFILASRGKVEAAAEAVRKCIEFRRSFIEEIRYVKKHAKTIDFDTVMRFLAAGWLEGLGDLKHPTLVIRIGKSNIRGLANTISYERLLRHMLMSTEVGFQRVDYLTRKTRRLIKAFNIIDLAGFSLTTVDKRFLDAQVEVSKIGNPVYPQLLGKVVMINANLAFRTIFRTIKPLIPRTTIDKQTVCPASGTSRESADINQCPFVRSMKASHQLPEFLGGSLLTPPEMEEPTQRIPSLVKHKVPSSRNFNIVEKDVTTANASAQIELLVVTSGSLTLEVVLNEVVLAGPFTISAKDGLVKKTFALTSQGRFQINAVNKSRYTRAIEVDVTIDEN